MVGDDLLSPGVDGSPVGHVEVLRDHLHAVPLATRHRRGQSNVVDIGQRQVRTAAGEFLGQCTTDARGSAGHGGHTSLEYPHVERTATAGCSGRTWASEGGGAPRRSENCMTASSMSLILSAR